MSRLCLKENAGHVLFPLLYTLENKRGTQKIEVWEMIFLFNWYRDQARSTEEKQPQVQFQARSKGGNTLPRKRANFLRVNFRNKNGHIFQCDTLYLVHSEMEELVVR